MIQIDMKIPKNCGECPCAYFTEGAFSDICQITGRGIVSEEKRDDCPLREVDDRIKKLEKKLRDVGSSPFDGQIGRK